MSSTGNRPPDSIKAYTKVGLRMYDALVMGVLARHVWDCPAENFVEHYRRHLTPNHAEIGVGTAYCLDRCGFDTPSPRLLLIDLQPNCLEFAAGRLDRYKPQICIHDALQSMRASDRRFDSIALGGVLHCLRGDMRRKTRVFDALGPLTSPGSKVFGYSLIADPPTRRARSRLVLFALNRAGVIDTSHDRVGDLTRELSNRFVSCTVELVGNMAFFSAVVPQRPAGHGLQAGGL